MQTIQANYQGSNMLDMVSFNLIQQMHPTFPFSQHQQSLQEQSSLPELMIPPTAAPGSVVHESAMIYSDLPIFLHDTISNKLTIDDGGYDPIMQNSYHISPSFALVPPITMETITSSCEDQELQKNLVKDVFFSPAMFENYGSRNSLSSQQSDDCHSLVSDTTTLSCGSPPYQYDEEEDQAAASDQVLFFYGLDLASSAAHSTTEEEKDTKLGLGTGLNDTIHTATFSYQQQAEGCNNNIYRRTNTETLLAVESGSKKSTCSKSSNKNDKKLKKKTTKTCNTDIKKLASPNRNARNQKLSCKNGNESTPFDSSDLTSQYYSLKEHKRSDNKKGDALKTAMEVIDETLLTLLPKNSSRSTSGPTIYQRLSKQNIDWCRYCGTTEGVNWRPGPWGKRTLCNKHGCDYKGYGFACKLPRLDLTSFASETIDKRSRPVLQLFCSHCQRQESWKENQLVLCDGCPKAYHQACYHQSDVLDDNFLDSGAPFYCSDDCQHNLRQKRVVVELPRKRLPLMRTPKNAILPDSASVSTSRLPRLSLREI